MTNLTNSYFYLAHFLIHCNILETDSTSSCPFVVNVYSTLGGISLYLFLSNMLFFSNSLSRIASVLVLNPFNACLNCLCLTGLVVQHKGISISSVPLFVIKFLKFAVSDISNKASYPSKLQSTFLFRTGNPFPLFFPLANSFHICTYFVQPFTHDNLNSFGCKQ